MRGVNVLQVSRGQKVSLDDIVGDRVRVGVNVDGPFTVDVCCFGLADNGLLVDEDFFVFYNQQTTPDGSIAIAEDPGEDLLAFDVDLVKVPDAVQRLVFTATIDGPGVMADIAGGRVAVIDAGEARLSFALEPGQFDRERAIILAALYRRDGWRFTGVAQGFNGGLEALLEHFGGVAEQGADPETPTVTSDLVATPAVATASEASPVAISETAPAPPTTDVAKPKRRRRKVATTKGSASVRPKWEQAARARLEKAIARAIDPLRELRERNANEGDTRLLVTEMLVEGLGFDRFRDLTTEMKVKADFADYGMHVEHELVAFLEVKRITTTINERHLKQVRNYALDAGVAWMILTNGAIWQAYHLTLKPGAPVETDLTIDVNLLGPDTPAQKADALFLLTRESLRRRQIDAYWHREQARSARSLARAILAEPVLDALRRELRRQTGHNEPVDEIKGLLVASVLQPECLKP
jgi:stress response protein SCP2